MIGQPDSKAQSTETRAVRRSALFVTCLVDLFRPTVGFAAVKLLEAAGCDVEVPAAQTCCGQPAYNSGDRAEPRAIARQVIAAFEPLRLCRGAVRLLRRHAQACTTRRCSPTTPTGRRGPTAFAAKVYELVSFLVDVRGMTERRGRLRRHRHLPRFLLGPARARRPRPAARGCSKSVAGLKLDRAARTPRSAAASAARSASSIPTSPTPSSRRRPRRSRRPAPARCSPAISAA